MEQYIVNIIEQYEACEKVIENEYEYENPHLSSKMCQKLIKKLDLTLKITNKPN